MNAIEMIERCANNQGEGTEIGEAERWDIWTVMYSNRDRYVPPFNAISIKEDL